MPHAHSSSAASSGGDDLGSTDEVKVFKDEGDGEDEKRSSENLLEEKSSLIDWTESEEKSGEPYSGKLSVKSDLSPVFGFFSPGKFEPHPAASFNMGYLMAPYPYPNGGAHPLPVSMTGKMGLSAGGGLSLFCPGGELGQPPPAHMGIPPPYQLDSKLAAGLARTPMYPFPGGTYPYPMLSPEMSQVAASWHTPSMYPISSAASGFRSPYPTSLPITSSSLSSELYRFSPTLGGGLGLGLGPALVPPPHSKADLFTHHSRSQEKGSSSSSAEKPADSSASNNKEQNKKPHIKKPLNAFMLYMKEMRAKVVAECTLKESAAINQILGRRWHALGREEQAKYYELARRERQLHMQLYPDWSSRANTQRGKKRKRKQETTDGGNNLKKCRARYGLDQQNQWCKPCRRKKKCVRYMEALAAAAGTVSLPMVTPQSPCSEEDVKLEELSDASSDEADTPLNSASSPGGLSALSSLASPASDPPPPPRNPVGTNPRDANNPLSVGQLTSQSWPRAAQARPGHEVISVS
ncbi:protein pangolin, isoforms A/H/I/S isoform X2 [Vanessa tameamea]|uniref:dTCF n=1 Tax=Vanessa tameamea TaxID=334116 RepID=A0A8B8HLE8_VANTA|nr:protein pangolin, isoforms A/H/I/S isoform X2 [Vanessa tameamea]XP_047540514.1 protein pangolin, isoforms A/H/I/S isoform X2 [Vanessa atalanta]